MGKIIILGKGAAAKKVAELHLYGEVMSIQSPDARAWGVISLTTVQDELKGLGGVDAFDEILLRINSPGGEVNEGFAIHNYIRSLGKPVTTIADGQVASIATVLFLAGDIRRAYTTTDFMIHNPWTYAAGNADQLEKTTEELRKMEAMILDFYVEKTGADRETLEMLMKGETHLSPDQTIELKFVTEIIEPIKAYAKAGSTNPTEKTNHMSKLKNLKASIIALFASEIVAVAFKTTDGKELQIDTGDSDVIAEGQTATIDGAAAPDGEYKGEDGRTVTIADGKVSAVKEAESTDEEKAAKAKADADAAAQAAAAASTEEVKALQTKVTELTAKAAALAAKEDEIKALKQTISDMEADTQSIYDYLKTVKVEVKVPTRTGLPNKDLPATETSKEEAVAKIKAFNEKKNAAKK